MKRNHPEQLLAITGSAGAGKSVAANFISNKIDSKQESFAGFIKNIVNEAICSNPKMALLIKYAGYEIKNDRLSDDQFEDLKNNNNVLLEVSPGIRMSVRSILQQLGTDVLRKISTDFHLKVLAHKMLNDEHPSELVIVPDVRFKNELNFVQLYNMAADKQFFLTKLAALSPESGITREQIQNNIYSIFGNSEFSFSLFKEVSKKTGELMEVEQKGAVIAYQLDNKPLMSETLVENVETGFLPVRAKANTNRLDQATSTHTSESFSQELESYFEQNPDAAFTNPYSPDNSPEKNSLENSSQMKDVVNQIQQNIEFNKGRKQRKADMLNAQKKSKKMANSRSIG